MTTTSKLQISSGQRVALLDLPDGLQISLPEGCSTTADADAADAVLFFARTAADVHRRRAPFVEAARRDALAWIAYPKGGQLDTDLNRDLLWKQLEPDGIRPVRQVSLSDVWSAVRFRPAS